MPKSVAPKESTATWSVPATTVSSRFTSSRSPPWGPLSVRIRTASRTVSFGRIALARSTRLSSSFWWIILRDPPITPIQFFMARVSLARL